MNCIFRKALTISILAVFSIVATGAALDQAAVSTPLPDSVAGDLVGAGVWSQFFSGVACGAGIVFMATGYASGLGAIPATLATVAVLKACSDAVGL